MNERQEINKILHSYIDVDKNSDYTNYKELITAIQDWHKAKSQESDSLPCVSGSLLSDLDYWKQRCELAEECLKESPCDPDITSDQIKAWNAYHKFISWAGNDR